jgi:hypothetical protein
MGEQKPALGDRWWGKVLLGVTILVGDFIAYIDFTKLDNGEYSSIKGKWFLLLYNVVGKWPTVALVGLQGAVLLGWGINQ